MDKVCIGWYKGLEVVRYGTKMGLDVGNRETDINKPNWVFLDTYFPVLLQICKERRDTVLERWNENYIGNDTKKYALLTYDGWKRARNSVGREAILGAKSTGPNVR